MLPFLPGEQGGELAVCFHPALHILQANLESGRPCPAMWIFARNCCQVLSETQLFRQSEVSPGESWRGNPW